MIPFAIGATAGLILLLLASEVFLILLMITHFAQLSQDESVYKESPTTWRQRVHRKYLRPGTTMGLIVLNTVAFIPGSFALIIYLISQL